MKKILLSLLVMFYALSSTSKSIVFTLNDKAGTRVYYKLSTEAPPRMILSDDGTFTLNGTQYEFQNVKSFTYSATDYSGEKGTVDGIISVDNDQMTFSGDVNVYDMSGKLVCTFRNNFSLSGLKKGAYIISNGTSSMKVMKK